MLIFITHKSRTTSHKRLHCKILVDNGRYIATFIYSSSLILYIEITPRCAHEMIHLVDEFHEPKAIVGI